TAIAARAGGASRIYISDVQPEKLGLLEGMEGIIPVDATKEDLGDRVRAETGGWGPQVVFEASGAAPAYKDLWSVPAPGGRIVLVGMPVEPGPFDIATAQSRGVSLETVFRYANVYQKAIDLAATDAVDLGRFVSETFPFDIAAARSLGVSLETVFRYANVYQQAVDPAATDAVDLGRFVSETCPFDTAVGAFERFLEGRPTDVKLQITL